MGGGVGRFFTNILPFECLHRHHFLLLEAPQNADFLDEQGVSWEVWACNVPRLEELVAKATLVEIDFWNHPALLIFLNRYVLPDCRLLVYSFVSGTHPPNILPIELFEFADWVIFPGPSSLNSVALPLIAKNYSVVFALGGVDRTKDIVHERHDGINVTYIGTASYQKLHSRFVDMCSNVLNRSEYVSFLIASNDTAEHISNQVHAKGIERKFEFFRNVSDIGSLLSKTDIFGYPLRSDHYGTGEQALLEAMGAGVPPVVLNNSAERLLVTNEETGIVVNGPEEYVEGVTRLASDRDLRRLLGRNARDYAIENFAQHKTVSEVQKIYGRVKKYSARDRSIDFVGDVSNDELGWKLFLKCLGYNAPPERWYRSDSPESRLYWLIESQKLEYVFFDNKGGLLAYLKYFPNDKILPIFLAELLLQLRS